MISEVRQTERRKYHESINYFENDDDYTIDECIEKLSYAFDGSYAHVEEHEVI